MDQVSISPNTTRELRNTKGSFFMKFNEELIRLSNLIYTTPGAFALMLGSKKSIYLSDDHLSGWQFFMPKNTEIAINASKKGLVQSVG